MYIGLRDALNQTDLISQIVPLTIKEKSSRARIPRSYRNTNRARMHKDMQVEEYFVNLDRRNSRSVSIALASFLSVPMFRGGS
ncbi:hypothetical protein LENED_009158 [Lentinula edodes]|uniref:Uncharacterized protein n=1 Tax=Lentinula edodes TaxID=5353 RepID=A0A1Q3EIZ6_LENED|nr:hypothetical protein LENED_009158 [Lentinula edodes]